MTRANLLVELSAEQVGHMISALACHVGEVLRNPFHLSVPAWLIDRGMRTLAVRMERHNSNGMAVAQWAEQQPGIAKVHYPGLPSHPDHGHARLVLAGFGGMVGLELKGGSKATERMLKRLKLIAHAPSLAGVETLISEPRLTSHKGIGPEGRAKIGIPDGFLRLSCGIEDAADIIGDLDQALGK